MTENMESDYVMLFGEKILLDEFNKPEDQYAQQASSLAGFNPLEFLDPHASSPPHLALALTEFSTSTSPAIKPPPPLTPADQKLRAHHAAATAALVRHGQQPTRRASSYQHRTNSLVTPAAPLPVGYSANGDLAAVPIVPHHAADVGALPGDVWLPASDDSLGLLSTSAPAVLLSSVEEDSAALSGIVGGSPPPLYTGPPAAATLAAAPAPNLLAGRTTSPSSRKRKKPSLIASQQNNSVRRAAYELGDHVLCNWQKQGQFFPGIITDIYSEQTRRYYTIKYDSDGGVERAVASQLKPIQEELPQRPRTKQNGSRPRASRDEKPNFDKIKKGVDKAFLHTNFSREQLRSYIRMHSIPHVYARRKKAEFIESILNYLEEH